MSSLSACAPGLALLLIPSIAGAASTVDLQPLRDLEKAQRGAVLGNPVDAHDPSIVRAAILMRDRERFPVAAEMDVPDPQITSRLRAWLDAEGITYRYLEHEPTYTSEQSAAARGEPLEIGAKALLLKADEIFVLVVLSAARKLDSKAAAKHFGVKRTRFATRDELLAQTGLPPGAVPPFGRPLLDLPLCIDRSITANEKTAFNAGSLTASIVMPTIDYLRLAQGALADVT